MPDPHERHLAAEVDRRDDARALGDWTCQDQDELPLDGPDDEPDRDDPDWFDHAGSRAIDDVPVGDVL